MENDNLATEIARLMEIAKERDTKFDLIVKELQDAQKNLEELKIKIQELEKLLAERTEHLQQMGQELHAVKINFSESQWYLGEEKAKNAALDNALKDCLKNRLEVEASLNQLREQFKTIQKELADAQWYLGEERSKRKKLEDELNMRKQQP